MPDLAPSYMSRDGYLIALTDGLVSHFKFCLLDSTLPAIRFILEISSFTEISISRNRLGTDFHLAWSEI